MKLISISFFTVIMLSLLISCNNSSTTTASGYTATANGLQYKIIKAASAEKIKVSDFVKYTSTLRTAKGNVIFASSQSGSDLYGECAAPKYKGDIIEILPLLGAGDSVSLMIPAKEFFKDESMLPKDVKSSDMLCLDLNIKEVYSADKYKNEIAPALLGAKYANESKQLEDFIASKGWKATKTASGLYIVNDKPGTGKQVEAGKKASMNYTGTLLDGTPFDSNVDPKFNHVAPFEFVVGQGQVIKGWDEGIPYFKVGGKGKLIIPARLGYGEQSQAKIPANSTLVFDVEVLDVKDN